MLLHIELRLEAEGKGEGERRPVGLGLRGWVWGLEGGWVVLCCDVFLIEEYFLS